MMVKIEETSSRGFLRFKKTVIFLCLIIFLVCIIAISWITKDSGWSAWCGSSGTFNVFAILGSVSGVVGLILYKLSPSIRKNIAHTIEQLPKQWDAIMDSGSTKYFNPLFYKISYGRYRKSVNTSIGMDQYGLPIVDTNIPLVSFNMGIYKRYYKVTMDVFDEVKKAAQDAPENQLDVYQLNHKINDFYDTIKDQLRIDVIGHKCMIVKTWNKGQLLIHKDNYLTFLNDHRAKSGWKAITNQTVKNARYRIAKLSGLLWLFTSIMLPSKVNRPYHNQKIYEPILNEFWALLQLWPSNINGIFHAFVDFIHDPKNELSYAYLEREYSKTMILTTILRKLNLLVTETKHYVNNTKSPDIDSFFKHLTSPSNPKSIVKFADVIKSMNPNPDLVNLNAIVKTMNPKNKKELIEQFKSNLSSMSISTDASDIEIYRILPYFKDNAMADLIKQHNKTIKLKRGKFNYFMDHHSRNPRIDTTHIDEDDSIVESMNFKLNALTFVNSKFGLNMPGKRVWNLNAKMDKISTELRILKDHLKAIDEELDSLEYDDDYADKKEQERATTMRRIHDLTAEEEKVKAIKRKEEDLRKMKDERIRMKDALMKDPSNPKIQSSLNSLTPIIEQQEQVVEQVKANLEASVLDESTQTDNFTTEDEVTEISDALDAQASSAKPNLESTVTDMNLSKTTEPDVKTLVDASVMVATATSRVDHFTDELARVKTTVGKLSRSNSLPSAAFKNLKKIDRDAPTNPSIDFAQQQTVKNIVAELEQKETEAQSLKAEIARLNQLTEAAHRQAETVSHKNEEDRIVILRLYEQITKLSEDQSVNAHEISSLRQQKEDLEKSVSDRNTELKTMQDQVQQLTSEIQMKDVEIDTQIKNLHRYETELRRFTLSGVLKSYAYKIILDKARTHRSALTAKLILTEESKANTEKDLQSARNEIGSIKSELDAAKAKSTQELNKIEKKKQKIEKLKQQSEDAKKDFEKQLGEVNSQIKQLMTNYKEKAKELNSTESEKQTLQTKTTDLISEAKHLAEQKDELGSQMSTMQKNIDSLQAQILQQTDVSKAEKLSLQAELQTSASANHELKHLSKQQLAQMRELEERLAALRDASSDEARELMKQLEESKRNNADTIRQKQELEQRVADQTGTIKQLEEQSLALEQELAEIESALRVELNNENQQLLDRLDDTNEQLRGKLNEVNELNEDSNGLADRQTNHIRQYRGQIDKIKEQKKSLHFKLQSVIDKHDEAIAQRDSAIKEKEKLDTLTSRLVEKVSRLKQKLADTKNNSSHEIMALQGELEALTSRNRTLVEQNTNLNQQADLHRHELNDAQAEVKDLTAELDRLKVDYEAEQAKYEIQSKSLEGVKILIEKHLQTISQLETENVNIKAQLQNARERINAQTNKGAELTQAAEKLAIAESELNSLRSQIRISEEKIKSLSKNVAFLSADKSRLTTDVAFLQDRLDKIDVKNQATLEALLAEHAAKLENIQAEHDEEIEAAFQNSKNCMQVGMALDKIALKNIPILLHEYAAKTTISLPLLKELNKFIVDLQKSVVNPPVIKIIPPNSEVYEAVKKLTESLKIRRCQMPFQNECKILGDNVGKALVLLIAIYDNLKNVPQLNIEKELQKCGQDLNDPHQLDSFELSNPEVGALIRFMKLARGFFEPNRRGSVIDVLDFMEMSDLSQYVDLSDENEFGRLSSIRTHLKSIVVTPKATNPKKPNVPQDVNPRKYLTNETILANLEEMASTDYDACIIKIVSGKELRTDEYTYVRTAITNVLEENSPLPFLTQEFSGKLTALLHNIEHVCRTDIRQDAKISSAKELGMRWSKISKEIKFMSNGDNSLVSPRAEKNR